jgi:hypothetical protein
MQLTEAEKKIIERSKIATSRWKKTRWIALPLVVSVIVMAIIYCLISPPIVAYILTGFSGYLGLIMLIRIFRSWNGIPTHELLLKLAEENAKTST